MVKTAPESPPIRALRLALQKSDQCRLSKTRDCYHSRTLLEQKSKMPVTANQLQEEVDQMEVWAEILGRMTKNKRTSISEACQK